MPTIPTRASTIRTGIAYKRLTHEAYLVREYQLCITRGWLPPVQPRPPKDQCKIRVWALAKPEPNLKQRARALLMDATKRARDEDEKKEKSI